MPWISAITGLLTALPELVKLLVSIWTYANKISGNDPAAYIVKLGGAFNQLNEAKTQEEHAHAAQALADSIAHLPPH